MTGSSGKFHMRRQEKEIKDRKTIEKIIEGAKYCHLGLVDSDKPYMVPIHFGYADNKVFFHSAKEGRKVELLKKNNHVCFNILTDVKIVDFGTKCTSEYKSVTGFGKANLIEEPEEKLQGLKTILHQTLGHEYDLRQQKIDSALLYRIDIEELTGKLSIIS